MEKHFVIKRDELPAFLLVHAPAGQMQFLKFYHRDIAGMKMPGDFVSLGGDLLFIYGYMKTAPDKTENKKLPKGNPHVKRA